MRVREGKKEREGSGRGGKGQQKKSTGSSYERYADKMAVCEKLRLCGEAAHHETNDGDEGGTRKGNDDENGRGNEGRV